MEKRLAGAMGVGLFVWALIQIRTGKVVCVSLLYVGFSLPVFARTISVDRAGGDFPAIQPAIDAATGGDVVLVAPGEYVITEPITFLGKAITVRSERGPGETTLRMAEEPADPDRASVVIFENGESDTSVLEGFTLTGGQGTEWDEFGEESGAGILCVNRSSPTLRDCSISRNTHRAEAVYCDDSSPTLTNCSISGNAGLGILCFGSSPTLTDCTITGNSLGGVGCLRSSPTMTGCTIWRNSWIGLSCGLNSSPTLTNCTISDNSNGGGMYCWSQSSPTLTNCTIAGNTAREGSGGVLCIDNSSPTLTDCIVWGNVRGSIGLDDNSIPQVTFSCIEGADVWPGESNIDSDPLFCAWSTAEESVSDREGLEEALSFSYALARLSPCVGSGKEGANMGADRGTCDAPGEATRTVHLAPGKYDIKGLNLSHRVSLEGVGEDETTIEGTVLGLRTGSLLARLTVTAGTGRGGIEVAAEEAPEILSCRIAGHAGNGVHCDTGSSVRLTNCTISQNLANGVYCGISAPPRLTNCTISGNSENGVYCRWGSSPWLTNCTISGNSWNGIHSGDLSRPRLTSCIVWHNVGEAIALERRSDPQVTFSSIEGAEVFAGEGNINADPLFCAWETAEEAVSDQRGFKDALSFSYALAESSPCVGSGEGGINMGADSGVCEAPGERRRIVRLAPGRFEIDGLHLSHRVSIEGAGEEETTIEGTVVGLRTGSVLSRLTVTGGASRGVVLGRDQAPEIVSCMISGDSLIGVYCDARSAPRLTNCTVSGNSRIAVYCGPASSATFTDCTITGSAREGVYCDEGASPVLVSCTISGNSGDGRVGGVYCGRNSSPTLTSCAITGNAGCGVYCVESSPTLTDCRISGNFGNRGGGVSCSDKSSPAFADCTISGNSAETSGGGVYCDRSSSAVLTNCTISGNAAALPDGTGGGFYCERSSPSLTNCTISGNSAAASGGGMYCRRDSSAVLTNCTISGNSASEGGGVWCSDSSSPTLTNCIVWDNVGGAIGVEGDSDPEVNYSSVEGGEVWPGEGNIDDDPLFARKAVFDFDRFAALEVAGVERQMPDFILDAGDYRLQPDSPAIDSGTSEGAPTADIEGNERPCGIGVDMGAHEYCEPPETFFRRGDANADGDSNHTDAIFILSHLFVRGSEPPPCRKAADANDTGTVDLTDAVYLLRFVFAAGTQPGRPFTECGPDPTLDELTCDAFAGCP